MQNIELCYVIKIINQKLIRTPENSRAYISLYVRTV